MTLKRKAPTALPSETLPPLADDLELTAARAAEAAILARMNESQQRRDRAIARLRSKGVRRNAAAVARSLIAGNIIPGANPEMEIAAADEELDALNSELVAQRQAIDEIAGQRAYSASLDCLPEYHAALRDAFQAMELLHKAAVECRRIKLALFAAGHTPSSIILPDIGSRAVLLLGDPRSPDTGRNEAAAFRRRLEALGIDVK